MGMPTDMIDMGVKHKEMYPTEPATPSSKKDYENEKTYPELSLSGPQAEMMGAEDLKEGDLIEQMVQWRVKRHSKTTENGKTNFSMTLCLEKASDCKECKDDADSNDEGTESDTDEDDSGENDSPAMAYITGRAKSSD